MKKVLWVTIVLAILLLFYYGAWLLGPGAFPYAEYYEFDVSEDSLISVIQAMKYDNPDFILPESIRMPDGGFVTLKDGRSDSTSHWYKIYFYYPETEQIILTWTRQNLNGKTTFAFAGINSFKEEWRWIGPNESFWWWQNQPRIAEFEHRILKKILFSERDSEFQKSKTL